MSNADEEIIIIDPWPLAKSMTLAERWKTGDLNCLIGKFNDWQQAGRPQLGVNHILGLIHFCNHNCAWMPLHKPIVSKIAEVMAEHCADANLCPTCGRALVEGECPRWKELNEWATNDNER